MTTCICGANAPPTRAVVPLLSWHDGRTETFDDCTTLTVQLHVHACEVSSIAVDHTLGAVGA